MGNFVAPYSLEFVTLKWWFRTKNKAISFILEILRNILIQKSQNLLNSTKSYYIFKEILQITLKTERETVAEWSKARDSNPAPKYGVVGSALPRTRAIILHIP